MSAKSPKNYVIRVSLANEVLARIHVEVLGEQRIVGWSQLSRLDFLYTQEALILALMHDLEAWHRVRLLAIWATIAQNIEKEEAAIGKTPPCPF